MLDQTVNLALTDGILVGKHCHDIRHLVAGTDHIVEVNKKVYVGSIFKAYTNLVQPFEQFTVTALSFNFDAIMRHC